MTKTIDDMSAEQLQKNITRAAGLLEELEGLLPGLVHFTAADRGDTDGRIRGKDEEDALRAVLAVIEHNPGAFQVLADKDDGHDPARVETELLRARLDRRAVLARLAERVAPLAQRLEDTVLAPGERCKPVLLSAYGIARSRRTTPRSRRCSRPRSIATAPSAARPPARAPRRRATRSGRRRRGISWGALYSARHRRAPRRGAVSSR